MAYYNTNRLIGNELKEAVSKAHSQGEAILLIYKNTRQQFTASDITKLTEKAGHRWPIWSNRRAITDLMKEKHLIKTTRQKMGPQGRPETFYQLNFEKYPAPSNVTQQDLFKKTA